jgi:hypothetical protein
MILHGAPIPRRPFSLSAQVFHADDPSPEWHERRRCHLGVRDPERDPDDREAEQTAGDQMTERQPPAGEDEPQDAADDADSLVASIGLDQGAAERSERVPAELQRLFRERQPNHCHSRQDRRDEVPDRQPEPSEDQPDEIQNEPHVPTTMARADGESEANREGRQGTP